MLMAVSTGPNLSFDYAYLMDKENKIWRRHNSGKMVYIPDMPDEYLQATIAMIKRGKDSHGRRVQADRDIYLPMLEEEARSRNLIPAEDGWDL